MNETLAKLRGVVGGGVGAEQLLLHTCRLEACGGEIVGNRSVSEHFRRAPFLLAVHPHVVQDDSTLAVLDATVANEPIAFFADTFDDQIGRLWRIGPAAVVPASTDPAISVAFDPLLSQTPDRVACDLRDHRGLSEAALPHLRSVAEMLCNRVFDPESDRTTRRSAFVRRAIDQNGCGAALLAVHELSTDPQRQKGFRSAAIFFRYAGVQLLHAIGCIDAAVQMQWTPRAWPRDSSSK